MHLQSVVSQLLFGLGGTRQCYSMSQTGSPSLFQAGILLAGKHLCNLSLLRQGKVGIVGNGCKSKIRKTMCPLNVMKVKFIHIGGCECHIDIAPLMQGSPDEEWLDWHHILESGQNSILWWRSSRYGSRINYTTHFLPFTISIAQVYEFYAIVIVASSIMVFFLYNYTMSIHFGW